MKSHGRPKPPPDDPDPGLDEAVAHIWRIKPHVHRGRLMVVLEIEDSLVAGHEMNWVQGTIKDAARFMSEMPRRGR